MLLEIKNLVVAVEGKKILDGINLYIDEGEIHAIMGPNGAGKSSLGLAIAGHPKYEILEGEVLFKGQNILELEPNERALLGLFLAFQSPVEIEGLTVRRFLWQSYKLRDSSNMSLNDFLKFVEENASKVGLTPEHLKRSLNVGFSGGEKKRNEMLQFLTLKPKLAILDEIDSGLDIDSLKIVGEIVDKSNKENNTSFMIITHYVKLFHYVKPHKVHVLMNGKIVKEGGPELLDVLDKKGYKGILENEL